MYWNSSIRRMGWGGGGGGAAASCCCFYVFVEISDSKIKKRGLKFLGRNKKVVLRGRIIENYFLAQLKEAIENDVPVYTYIDGKEGGYGVIHQYAGVFQVGA